MRLRSSYLALIGVALSGCMATPAEPQWRVVISTDAPVPQFGDRLLVEVLYDDGAECTACRRQFSATEWPLSFGVVPPASGGVRVRARLYRTAITGYDGSPGSDRVIDALVRMPPADGVTQVGISLRMRCFGVLSNPSSDSTCDPETGALAPVKTGAVLADEASLPEPGTWAPAQRVDCAGPVEAGMVCIPGGAFLMGRPDHLPLADLDPVPEQLVQVSPFALDADEMSVGAMRALVPTVGAPAAKGSGDAAFCTYTPSPSADGLSETMPVNCVSLALARSACKALGKRLPTEAEWEWAAGNLGLETRYPWGSGDPCSYAIVGHGKAGNEMTASDCAADVPGPRPVRSADDETLLGVHDLGGNLSEWIEGDFQPFTDTTCWGPAATLHVDPSCEKHGLPILRGGSWARASIFARVGLRGASTNANANHDTGFRCAK